jgi:uncharacterized protein
MQRFWAAMAVQFGKHVRLVIAAVVLITLVLGFGLRNLEFATGQDSYLNETDQVAIDNVAYQDLFGGQAMLTLWSSEGEADLVDLLSSSENRAAMQEAADRLRADDGVLAVIDPVTAITLTENLVVGGAEGVAGQMLLGAVARETDPEAAAIRTADAGTTLERLTAAGEQSLDNPAWVDFLLNDNQGEIRKALRSFFPDREHAQMLTRLVGNADIVEEGETAETVVAATAGLDFEGWDTLTTGAPVLLKDINDYLQGGMLTLGAIALAVMAAVLFLVFRVRWRLLSLGVVVVGLIWAFGAFGYTGIPLSLVTISGLPILIGVGVDFAIQMHSRVEEEVVIDHDAHPIAQTTTNLVPPLIIATIAAVAGFAALQLSAVPMIRDFSVLLSIGIVTLCLVGVVLPTALLGAREYRSRTETGDYSHGVLGRIVVVLGSLPKALGPVLVVAGVAIFVGGIFAEGSFRLQSDPEEWVDQSSQVVADIETLRQETGSAAELGYYIQADDVFTDDMAAFVHDFVYRETEGNDELLTASSLVTTVSFLLEIPGTTNLPPTGEDVRAVYEAAPPDIQRSLLADNGEALNVVYRVGAGSLEERADLIDAIEERLDPPEGISATASGLAVVGVGLLRNAEENRALLTYAALALVAVWLVIRLMSVVRALLAMVPVLIAVGGSSLIIAGLGFELSPLTTVSGPLVVAICTEFSVLILVRYLEERRRGCAPKEATDVASARTGRAFVTSALTTVGGFLVLVFSAMPLLRDFGAIVALNVTVALLSALVVLPPLLVWADGKGWVIRERGRGRNGRELDFRDDVLTSSEPLNLVTDSHAGNGAGVPASGRGDLR